MSLFDEQFMEQYNLMPEYSISALFVDTTMYLPAITNAMIHTTEQREMGGSYITITRPARAIMSKLRAEKVPMADIYFIDCISYTVGGKGVISDNVVNLESPTVLETILLKVDWAYRQIRTPKSFVLLDSVNVLSIYNKKRILKEFLHVFINRLRSRDIFAILLSIGHELDGEMEEMLRLNCDETVDLRKQ